MLDPRRRHHVAVEELYGLVRRIPAGRCAAYSALGRSLERPVSGLIVGRWMANCPPDVPWWRVVAADGRLPVWKRSEHLERDQRQSLEAEGVEFEEDRVLPNYLLSGDEITLLR